MAPNALMLYWVHAAWHFYKFWISSQVKPYSFSRFSFHISFKKIAQPSSLLLLSPWLISSPLNAPSSFLHLYFHSRKGNLTWHLVADSHWDCVLQPGFGDGGGRRMTLVGTLVERHPFLFSTPAPTAPHLCSFPSTNFYNYSQPPLTYSA